MDRGEEEDKVKEISEKVSEKHKESSQAGGYRNQRRGHTRTRRNRAPHCYRGKRRKESRKYILRRRGGRREEKEEGSYNRVTKTFPSPLSRREASEKGRGAG